MSNDFNFDLAKPIETQTQVEVHSTKSGNTAPKGPATPEAERIAFAREQALEWRRNPENQIFEKPQSYFESSCGIGSSRWDADFLTNWLHTLGAPWEFGAYFSREGAFRQGNRITPIADLRRALEARLQDFGLSMLDLYGHESRGHSHEDFLTMVRGPLEARVALLRREVAW
jgi:hypothetical protein